MPESDIDVNAVSKSHDFIAIATQASTLHKPSNYIQSYFSNTTKKGSKAHHILCDPRYNKMTAFTKKEREYLGLVGLLPPVIETIEVQVCRAYKQLMQFSVPLAKQIYLSSLRERSETLFYRLVLDHFETIIPIIYTPTVGQACLEYGLQFRTAEGMYISNLEKGRIKDVLDNWKANINDEVSIIVVTDGSRILGLGDLGACGIGISIGKLVLYVAAAGFHPSTTLPMLIDVGTDNKSLREDELYLGLRQPRVNDEEYYELLDEFMESVYSRWPNVLVQFEDFSNNHCFKVLEKYRKNFLCFNDDIQGTGVVIAAGFLNALKVTNIDPEKCKIVFLGAGAAAIGVASQIIQTISREYDINANSFREMFYIIDTKGLVVCDRPGDLQYFKAPFARKDYLYNDVENKSLLELIQLIQPAALIGLSGQAGMFTKDILQYMASINNQPIIFPLSNPTVKTECTFEEAIFATKGRVVFASGSPFQPVKYNEAVYKAPQGNNLYIFPGLGFGAWLSRAKYISDSMLLEATRTLASLVSQEQLQQKILYPELNKIREVSAQIAAVVMQVAYKEGLSQLETQPSDYISFVKSCQYYPTYLTDIDT